MQMKFSSPARERATLAKWLALIPADRVAAILARCGVDDVRRLDLKYARWVFRAVKAVRAELEASAIEEEDEENVSVEDVLEEQRAYIAAKVESYMSDALRRRRESDAFDRAAVENRRDMLTDSMNDAFTALCAARRDVENWNAIHRDKSLGEDVRKPHQAALDAAEAAIDKAILAQRKKVEEAKNGARVALARFKGLEKNCNRSRNAYRAYIKASDAYNHAQEAAEAAEDSAASQAPLNATIERLLALRSKIDGEVRSAYRAVAKRLADAELRQRDAERAYARAKHNLEIFRANIV